MALTNIVQLHSRMSTLDPKELKDHAQLLKISKALVTELESPAEQGMDLMFSFAIVPALCIAADLGLFGLLQDAPRPLSELSTATGADMTLLVRILRILTTVGACQLTGPATYAATPITRFFAIPAISDGIKFNFDLGFRPCAQLPAFLRHHAFCNIDESMHTPFHEMFNTKLHWFEWLKTQAREWTSFNSFMTSYRESKAPWTDIFPAEGRVYADLSSAERARVTVVDVGGGYGQDLLLIQSKFNVTPSSLILQDTREVIGAAGPDLRERGVEVQAYDFFAPQPMLGARVYLLKHLLHDWPDREAVKILSNTAEVMVAGYSKVLIVENVLPDSEVPLATAGLDMLLMVNLAGGERTERQWRE